MQANTGFSGANDDHSREMGGVLSVIAWFDRDREEPYEDCINCGEKRIEESLGRGQDPKKIAQEAETVWFNQIYTQRTRIRAHAHA